MRNVYEVLQEKENAAQRIAREIEILRLAAPLLIDDAPFHPALNPALNHDLPGHDAFSPGDAPAQDDCMPKVETENSTYDNAKTDNSETGESLAHEDLITQEHPFHEEVPTDSAPMHEIREDEANTGSVSAPSLLTHEPNDVDSAGQDEADSVPQERISGRLRRLVRPLVSLVAG